MKLALAQRYDKYYNTPYQRKYFYDLFIFLMSINVSVREVQTGVRSGWMLSVLVAYLHIKWSILGEMLILLLRSAYFANKWDGGWKYEKFERFCNSLIIINISSMCPKWRRKALFDAFILYIGLVCII